MAPNAPAPTTAEIIGGIYNVTPPVLLDGQAAAIQIDVNGNIKTSGGGGGGGNVNVTGINSVAPALTNPLPVELSDGALAVGTPSNPLTATSHKSTVILSTTPLAGGGNFTSSWFDTNVTGDIFVETSLRVTGGTNGTIILQESDDTGGLTQSNVQLITYSVDGQVWTPQGLIRKRYWRVFVNNVGGTIQTTLELTATSASQGAVLITGTGVSNTVLNQIPVSIVANGAPSDGGSTPLGVLQGNAVIQPLSVAIYASQGSITNAVLIRVPTTFKTAAATNAGNTAAWTPAAGKKFRLMRYQIELTENATLAVAAVVTVKFQDNVTDFGFQHDQYIPAAAGVATGEAWRSGWIDIGNGYLSTVANNVLNFNIGGGNNLTAGQFRINVCGTEE